MCRNIKPLSNFEPPATADEIRAAAIQFVRKISGFQKPSATNEKAFNAAVEEIAQSAEKLIDSLVIIAPPKNREAEREKAKEKNKRRFGA